MFVQAAEHLLFHLRHHIQRALMPLRLALRQKTEMTDLCAGEQGRRSIRAGGDAGAATDAGCRIHREVGILFGNGNDVLPSGALPVETEMYPPARDDAVEGAAVHDQIFDDGKRFCAPRFEVKHVAVFEVTHVELAHRVARLRSVSDSVDHESARSANPFAAIVIERDRLFALRDELFVEHVQHFQETTCAD